MEKITKEEYFMKLTKEDLLKYLFDNEKKYVYTPEPNEKLPLYTEAIVTRNRCPYPAKEFYKNPLIWSFESIINQTYLPEEIIILNDCSDVAPLDYTEEIVKIIKQRCEEKKVKLVYYKNAEHKNLAESRNLALKLSQNKLIHFLDDDCILYPKAMASAVALFEKVKKIDIGIAILNMPQASRSSHPVRLGRIEKMTKINLDTLELIGTVSATFPLEYMDNPPCWNKDKKIIKPLLLENFQAGNLLADKDILFKLGGFVDYHSIISYAEDGGLIAKLLKNNYKIYYFPYLNMHAVHASYGNYGGLQEFFGNDWLDTVENKGYNLKQMIKESVVFREGSGCRIRKEIYFYVKIRNFFLMLEDFKAGTGEKWAIKSREDFVEKDKIEFQDKKGSVEDKNLRYKIWKQAVEDAKNNTSFKSVEEFLNFLKI